MTRAFGGWMCAVMFACGMHAQELSTTERQKVEAAVEKVVNATHVPSISVGIARGGKVVYARAEGSAVLERKLGVKHGDGREMQISVATEKPLPAAAEMAYPVGSISKQFTAACVLLLQERGKLKLDDPVSRWFPNFTRAKEVTVRNLLTHTSGYSDYAPQDYTIPAWTKPVKSLDLVTEWATKPLDFDPGTKWQYSNTNFQIAALIVEKVSGMRFHDFLWEQVVEPLKLQDVLDLDVDRGRLQVTGYEQHALGPMRPAILEAPGWYTGDGGLAMPVRTLLAWDESIVHRSLLKPESYDEMEKEYVLKDGTPSHYGLGVFVRSMPGGTKAIYHSGEVGGYVSNNVVFLQEDVSFAALTNQEASSAAGMATSELRQILMPAAFPPRTSTQASGTAVAEKAEKPAETDASTKQVAQILKSLQGGRLDRGMFTADANFYFNAETVEDFRSSLGQLGEVEDVRKKGETLRGGMVFRSYEVRFAKGHVGVTTYTTPDGKLEQFLAAPEE